MNRTVLIGRATLWGHHLIWCGCGGGFCLFLLFFFTFFVFYINCGGKCSGVSYIYENISI
ncbi:hypothetical protein BHE74_00043932 [Ensete ventricosum]|nr:hypothetical protein GW17_00013570 [Ensete ventricosum]RWW49849.1 hypothetical protein BHE74_00043932 [Ensete ventricosum]RZR89830.1 hypothetical protein BHM03_00017624 [Ensete ventricosum]